MILVFFGFLTGGPYYDMIGRTGNNVGRRVKGKNVFSMRPSPSHKPATQLQMNQRNKWTLVTTFLSWLTPVLNIGFKDYTSHMSGFNAAVSYNLRNAVVGVPPDFSLNFAKVSFSRGDLSNLNTPEAATAAGGKITLTWVNVEGEVLSNDDDDVTIVVYNTTIEAYVRLIKVVKRSAETLLIQLPIEWVGDEVGLWFFTSDVKNIGVSNSRYFGEITVI